MSNSTTNYQQETPDMAKSKASDAVPTPHSPLPPPPPPPLPTPRASSAPRSLRLPKPVRTILVAIVLLAAVSAAIYAARRAWPSGSSEISPLVVPVQPRDFTLKIYAEGELQSAES